MDAGAGMGRDTVRNGKSEANGKSSGSGGSEEVVVAGEKARMVASEEREEMPSERGALSGAGAQARQQAGPRPAPSYRVVSAVIEKKEDGPGPR
jgi:hypothetical protein